MYPKSYILFSILICYVSGKAFSQSIRDSTRGKAGIELTMTYGFVIAHRPVLEILQENHTYGAELSYLKPADGSRSFHERFLFPDVGWTLAWFNLGNPDRLGSGIAVYPFVNFPLHLKKDWRLHFRYGMGLGYIEKVFDPVENPKNAAIGSHLNGVMHFDLHMEKNLGKSSVLELGAGITHYSNGSSEIPNLGINIASAQLGFMHYFGEKKGITQKSGQSDIASPKFQVFGAGAFKKIYPPLGETFFAGTLSFSHIRPVRRKSNWGFGAELFYDQSIREKFRQQGIDESSNANNFRPGIYGIYEIRLGQVGMLFNMGVYPYTKWKDDGNFYHRICSRYYFDTIFLLMNLKTHFAKADFIEWGVGCIL
jgi:hypothetical protein